MKKIIVPTIVVFVAWSILDYVIHVVILGSAYQATATLWRPAGEMKMTLMYVVTLIYALAVVVVYAKFIADKGVATGLKFGFWLGLGTGVGMGYGTYSVMPIPYSMALTWFLGTLVEMMVAGLIVGSMDKGERAAEA